MDTFSFVDNETEKNHSKPKRAWASYHHAALIAQPSQELNIK